MSDDEIMDRLTLAKGFSMIAWATENNGIAPVDRVGRGYIGREIDQRLKETR